MRQLATSLPSTCTEHAPQSPVPQPSLGPVRPSSSRSASSRVWYGGTSTSTSSSLTVQRRICFATRSPSGSGARPLARRGERAAGEDADEVTAVLGGAALIADGARGGHRQRGGRLDALGGEGLAFQRVLRLDGPHRRGRHRRERDAGLGADAVGERELRGHPHHRDIQLAPWCMAQVVTTATRRRLGDDQLQQQLVGAEHGTADPLEEGCHRHAAPALGPGDHRFRLQREQRRRHVRGGRGIAEIAAEGGKVTDLDGADQRGALRDGGIFRADARVQLELPRGHRRADPQTAAGVALDRAQLLHAGQIHHQRGLEEAVLELGQEIGPSRHQLDVRPMARHGLEAVVHARRQRQIESSHAVSPVPDTGWLGTAGSRGEMLPSAAVLRRWFLLTLLTVAYGMGAFGMLGVSPLAPSLVEGFRLSRLDVAFIVPSVYLGDRWGVRPTFLGGLTLGAGGLALAAAAPRFWMFLGCLFLAGVGWSVVNPVLGKAIVDLFPVRERGIAMGIKQMGLTVGGVISALTLPPIAAALGWRAAVATCAIVMGAPALASWPLLAPLGTARTRAVGDPEATPASNWWWLRRPALLVLFSTGIVLGMTQSAVLAYLPLYGVQVLGLTAVAAGALVAAAQAGGAAARLGLGAASDRWLGGRRPPWLG